MSDEELTIRSLEKLSGYSARSIHHYISRGLLPNPEGSGPAARYGREHLARLLLIEEAKRAGFKIDKRLQELLDDLTLEEMEQMAANARQASPEDNRAFGEWLMTGAWRSDRKRKSSASKLAGRLPSTAAMLGGERSARKRTIVRQDSHAYSSEPERWERVRFGDAVEISWRDPIRDPRLKRKVEKLLRKAASLLDHEDNQK